MTDADKGWRRCSACKKTIGFGATYWVCNVSTCNRKRTGLVFCSVSCWEVHLPGANHREAWALERSAPSAAEAARQAAAEGGGGEGARSPRRILPAARPPARPAGGDTSREVLVVASRLKDYVRARSGMNTSDAVLEPLSDAIRRLVDRAIDTARREGRRTVLDRDVPRG